jgi:thiamine-phosphate pyrophosphorylase
MIFGLSATSYEEALRMDALNPDYLGVGPIFPTSSKDDATPPMGLPMLRRVCRDVQAPVVAIGGIDMHTLASIFEAGAVGVALISAVTYAPDMVAAVRELQQMSQCAKAGCQA